MSARSTVSLPLSLPWPLAGWVTVTGARCGGAAQVVVNQLEPLEVQGEGRSAVGGEAHAPIAGDRPASWVGAGEAADNDGVLTEGRVHLEVLQREPRADIAEFAVLQRSLPHRLNVVQRALQGSGGGHVSGERALAAGQQIPQGPDLPIRGIGPAQGLGSGDGDAERGPLKLRRGRSITPLDFNPSALLATAST